MNSLNHHNKLEPKTYWSQGLRETITKTQSQLFLLLGDPKKYYKHNEISKLQWLNSQISNSCLSLNQKNLQRLARHFNNARSWKWDSSKSIRKLSKLIDNKNTLVSDWKQLWLADEELWI